MSRKLKGKSTSKGLKGALLRHQSNEKQQIKLKKRQQYELQKGKSTKQALRNKEAQKRLVPKLIPFSKDSTLMLVGEGDFSYARSIIEQDYIRPENLIVTSYDSSETELSLKYPHSFLENHKFLESNGVKVIYKVDATNLIKSLKITKKTPWHKIVGHSWLGKPLQNILFNFPHTGRGIKDQGRNINEHQELVFGYFKSSQHLFEMINNSKENLQSNRCLGGYSLTNEPKIDTQGYGKVAISVFSGEPYDSWHIKILAKENGWKLERSGKFEWSSYPSYNHKRTNSEISTTKPAEERDARVYIFERYNKAKHSRETKKNTDSDSE